MLVRHHEGLVGFEIPDDSPLARAITLEEIKREAAARFAPYPQYDGYTEAFVLFEVKRRIRTKMGVAFEKGEFAAGFAREAEYSNRDGAEILPAGFSLYSRSNRIMTFLDAADAEPLS